MKALHIKSGSLSEKCIAIGNLVDNDRGRIDSWSGPRILDKVSRFATL